MKNKCYQYTKGKVTLQSNDENFSNSEIPTAVELLLTPNPWWFFDQ